MSLLNFSSYPLTSPTVIYPTAVQFADSLTNIPIIINGITAIRTNVHGRLIIHVPSGTTSLTFWPGSNLETFVGYDFAAAVYVDGVYTTEYLPDIPSIPSVQSFTLTLDGQNHTVEFWTGFQNYLTGTYCYAIQGKGISIVTAPNVTRRLACYGDSITGGAAASPVGQLGWFARLRGVFPGAIAQEAFGGRMLFDDCGSGSGQIGFANVGLLAARLIAMNQGVSNRAVWINIGINDVAAGHWDAATFGTNYAALLDAIHAQDPACQIFAQSMLITTTLEGSAPAWRSQIQTVANARSSFVTYVSGPSMMDVSGLAFDGLHPSNAGHASVFNAMRGILSV